MAHSGHPGFSIGSEGGMDFQSYFDSLNPGLMAYSGQPGFSVGSEGGMDLWSYLNSLDPGMSSNPLLEGFSGSISMSEIPELQTLGTQFNSQQCAQPQPAGTGSGVVRNQHLTDIDVSRTVTPEMTPEKTLKKRKADKEYRGRQKLAKIQMQNELGRLNDENANLRKENEGLKLDNTSMNETLQFQAKMIDQLKRDLAKLKSNNEMQNAAEQHLAKLVTGMDFIE